MTTLEVLVCDSSTRLCKEEYILAFQTYKINFTFLRRVNPLFMFQLFYGFLFAYKMRD